jgi:hypothetical protein
MIVVVVHRPKKNEQPFEFHLNFARYQRLYGCGTYDLNGI